MKIDNFLNHVREQHDEEDDYIDGTYGAELRKLGKAWEDLGLVIKKSEMKIGTREFIGWFLRGLVFAALLVAFGFLIFGRK
jgi:hypothetical protein